MTKRTVYELRWAKAAKHWILCRGTIQERGYAGLTKAYACKDARQWVRQQWEESGRPCQLLVKNKDGRIASGGGAEASFGCDSRRRRG